MFYVHFWLAVAASSPSNPTLMFLTGLLAIALALVHIFSGKLRFLEVTPRSIWLSLADGVSVAYVFVHILPELGQ
ncbi:MAG: hypothetical protein C4323_21315 [Mastigocladus sp. ERB_26_2]